MAYCKINSCYNACYNTSRKYVLIIIRKKHEKSLDKLEIPSLKPLNIQAFAEKKDSDKLTEVPSWGTRAQDIRWISAMRRPERSEERTLHLTSSVSRFSSNSCLCKHNRSFPQSTRK